MATDPNLQDQRDPFRLRLLPGFFTETSADGAPTRWKGGDKVRFKNGQPEKFGGWVEQVVTGAAHYGIPRRTHEWTSLDGESWIAEASNSKLYLINRDIRYDITPIRRNVTLTNPFATTNLDSMVTVTDLNHSAETGDFVRFSGASAVGGLTIDGEYQIVSVIDADNYVIDAGTPAGSTTTGGGTVSVQYDINAMAESQGLATGWGVCAWGEDTWGTARSESCSEVVRRLGLWSLDNFGEDLIASPRGGAIYWWDRTTGPESRAVVLQTAPPTNQRVLISNTGAQIIALGAYDSVSGTPDPMLIRVGAEESLTDFVVAEDSTAFDERLATGSEIITGVRTRGGILVGTDKAMYIMREDPNEIFDVDGLGQHNGPLCPNGMIEVDGIGYWIATNKFFRFDGVLDEIPCDVWQTIFAETIDNAENTQRIDLEQADKIYSWYNDKFSEIVWLYPSVGGTGECDSYVIFNKELGVWYTGTIARTVGHDSGPSYGKGIPFAFGSDGTLYLHEVGEDADGEAMDAYIESHDLVIGAGKYEWAISQVVPNMVRQIGNILLSLMGKEDPSDPTYITKGPYTITTTTKRKGVRITSRQIAVRIGSNELGASWRLGEWRFYGQQDSEE